MPASTRAMPYLEFRNKVRLSLSESLVLSATLEKDLSVLMEGQVLLHLLKLHSLIKIH
jgi:hypothetical protein